MKSYLQRMGRSLQLPVAVLPAASLIVGIGNWWDSVHPDAISAFLQAGGNAILGQLALLFAVGLALGMSKDKDGSAALAGVVAYFVPVSILAPDSVATLMGIKVGAVDPAFSHIANNVLVGIIAGLIAAALYNRFHNTKLPMAFSFFSGKRLVPIMASVVMLGVTVILMFVWPPVYDALVTFGKTFVSMGAVGAGLYGFFNRLLIPTGLHQALNSVFWFDVAGINDIGKFLSSQGPKGITGMYQAGFFPVMMFGLPAGAYAIYRNARPENKKVTASLMLAGAFASFFTGVTEPLEFSFMFVAWPLYVLHAVFMGLSLAFAAFMHWTAGFAFSAGLVDYVLSLKNPIANQPYMLIVQGLVMAVIYYFGFNFAIKKFNLMTPGREKAEAASVDDAAVATDSTDDKYMIQAKKIYAAIGGSDNITNIDNCTTRLRLQLDDTDKINQGKIKSAGAVGVNALDKTNLQIIIGTEVQFTADALAKLYEEKAPVATASEDQTTETPAEEAATVSEPNVHSGATDDFYSLANGELLNIEEVSDPTFAQKMIGDGYAVEPTSGEIVSPVSGKITTIFPTKHALGITTENGLEVLVHMGLDTVELNGKPFELHVSEGESIEHGAKLATVDLDAIKEAGKKTTMLVVVTNMTAVGYFKFATADRQVTTDEAVLKATVK